VTCVAHDTRDSVVDFIRYWSTLTELAVGCFVRWIGISPRKHLLWHARYGLSNQHNALIPRDRWLEDWEKRAIIDFYHLHPLEGYRLITFMMLDANVVAVSPASVYRVLRAAGLIDQRGRKPSRKGTGFLQPLAPHDHWHIDFSYINIAGEHRHVVVRVVEKAKQITTEARCRSAMCMGCCSIASPNQRRNTSAVRSLLAKSSFTCVPGASPNPSRQPSSNS
jgi:hypothetical protein